MKRGRVEAKVKCTANTLQRERRNLPIYAARSSLLSTIASNETLIVVGQTGSGKTTQIPQYLIEAKAVKAGRRVAVTQPRRVAAVTVARRVAEEMGTELGTGTVGYSVRFEDCTSAETRVKYMTDGMLLRETMLDPLLSSYGVVILDEAHERTLHTDILFGLVKAAQKSRNGSSKNKLKVIVMSATLDAELFARYFGGSGSDNTAVEIAWIEGRQYPVDVFYTPQPELDYVDAAITAAMQIHLDEPLPGDVLVFLTGQEEIEDVARMLRERSKVLAPSTPKLLVCPIYAALPSEMQMRAFEPAPPHTRKVLLATNIAETSITIPGVRYVIDSGVVKARSFNAKIGIDTLAVVPVSKAQARQRTGRAGREGPGKCFRLYTELSFEKLADNTVPEILRCNLATIVLQLKALGIEDVVRFDYIEAPPKHSLIKALEMLLSLRALNEEDGKISELGKKMALFPLDPQYSVVLLKANELGCSEEALTVVSMMSVESVFFHNTSAKDEAGERSQADARRQRFASQYGDQLTMLAVFLEYSGIGNNDSKGIGAKRQWCKSNGIDFKTITKVENVRRQLAEYSEQLGLRPSHSADDGAWEPLRRALTAGLFHHAVVQRPDKKYHTVLGNMKVHVHPGSVLFGVRPQPASLIYNELVYTTKSYMRDILVIDQRWLPELAPHVFRSRVSSTI